MIILFYDYNVEKSHFENRFKYILLKCIYLHEILNLTKWVTSK
jgi:hypothetical protein